MAHIEIPRLCLAIFLPRSAEIDRPLADFCGGGLADLVRIRDERVVAIVIARAEARTESVEASLTLADLIQIAGLVVNAGLLVGLITEIRHSAKARAEDAALTRRQETMDALRALTMEVQRVVEVTRRFSGRLPMTTSSGPRAARLDCSPGQFQRARRIVCGEARRHRGSETDTQLLRRLFAGRGTRDL